MPHSEYIRPSGPFLSAEAITRSDFRFDGRQRKTLASFLPSELSKLHIPDENKKSAADAVHQPAFDLLTCADWAIHETEGAIAAHQTALGMAGDKTGRMNPANACSAIRRLREALEPFARGWVDEETAELIPHGLVQALADREQELKSVKVGAPHHRFLEVTCSCIGEMLKQVAHANGLKLDQRRLRKFVSAALVFGGIEHPHPENHPERLDRLIFPAAPSVQSRPLEG
jgi:hypothetical protein